MTLKTSISQSEQATVGYKHPVYSLEPTVGLGRQIIDFLTSCYFLVDLVVIFGDGRENCQSATVNSSPPIRLYSSLSSRTCAKNKIGDNKFLMTHDVLFTVFMMQLTKAMFTLGPNLDQIVFTLQLRAKPI
jgi:hypothetical protein